MNTGSTALIPRHAAAGGVLHGLHLHGAVSGAELHPLLPEAGEFQLLSTMRTNSPMSSGRAAKLTAPALKLAPVTSADADAAATDHSLSLSSSSFQSYHKRPPYAVTPCDRSHIMILVPLRCRNGGL